MPQGDDELYPPGTQFAAYRIVRPLGQGSYGAVYEALHDDTGARVALKVLHERLTRHPQALQRFLREADAIARLRHPFIVDSYEAGETMGVPFLAMEYLEGETLADLLAREKALRVADALALVLPIVAALAALHDHDGVHRDVKPANIFVARRGGETVPKLLDFGIVKMRAVGDVLTRTSSMLGTPAYMSPEQVRESKHVDARADQWAIAVVLYECLAGRRLFTGKALLHVLTSVATQPIRSLRTVRADVSVELDAVVLRALRREPSERFDTMRAFGQALCEFADASTQRRVGALLVERFEADVSLADFEGDDESLAEQTLPMPGPAVETVPPTSTWPMLEGSVPGASFEPLQVAPPPRTHEPTRVPATSAMKGALALGAMALLAALVVGITRSTDAPETTEANLPLVPVRAPEAPVAPTPTPDPTLLAAQTVLSHATSVRASDAAAATPYEQALRCREGAPDAHQERLCVIDRLHGRAATEPEIRLLMAAYRDEHQEALATQALRAFIASAPKSGIAAEQAMLRRSAISVLRGCTSPPFRRCEARRGRGGIRPVCEPAQPGYVGDLDATLLFDEMGRVHELVLRTPAPTSGSRDCFDRALRRILVAPAPSHAVTIFHTFDGSDDGWGL